VTGVQTCALPIFDPVSGAVTHAASLPQALSDPNAVAFGRGIVILGGGTNGVFELAHARH